MDFQTIIIISAILNLIMLICFLVLCDNVASIKKRIGGTETTRMDKFNIYVLTGQIERAKEILSQMIISEPNWQYVITMDSARKALATKYAKMLDAVGLSLDFDLIDKINK